MTQNLELIDYVVLFAYLAVTLIVGLRVGTGLRTGNDFFLAGRSLPWWAVGMSLVATDIGGTDIIGGGGAAYKYGMAVGNFEWIGCVPAMIVGAFIFIPHFWRSGITTIPEFFERRFHVSVRAAVAGCWLVFMACNLGVMLLASAKLMHGLAGWNESFTIFLTAGLVGAYTCSGGLAAVVYTDVIQGVVMIVGCLLVVVIGLADIGGIAELRRGIEDLERAQRENAALQGNSSISQIESSSQHLALILPADTKSPFPWTGIFFGLTLVVSPAYWIGNQSIVQRALGARSEFEAKAAYVWGALLKNLIPVIVVLPGLIALVRFPGLEDGDQALPKLIGSVIPAGVRGIFVAAFLAALMSSVDSYLNSAATILTNDFYRRFVNRAAGDRQLLIVGRLTTIGLLIWAVWFAFLIAGLKEGVYAIFQTMMSFFQGPALAVLLLGLFWRRATGPAACCGFLGGVLTAVSLYALNHPVIQTALEVPPLFRISEPYLYFSIWATLVTLALVTVLSLVTTPPTEEKLRFMLWSQPALPDSLNKP